MDNIQNMSMYQVYLEHLVESGATLLKFKNVISVKFELINEFLNYMDIMGANGIRLGIYKNLEQFFNDYKKRVQFFRDKV